MKLEEFKRTHEGKQARYVSDLADVEGNKQFLINITGPDNLIKKVFAESNFDIKIDQKGTKEDFKKEQSTFWESNSKKFSKSQKPEEDFWDIFKKKSIPKPAKDDSIIVSLEKIDGEGTFYAIAVPLLVPRGISVFFHFPVVQWTSGIVIPTSGDPDLELYSFSSLVSSSRKSSGSDRVSHSSFWPTNTHLRVYGFSTTVCSIYAQAMSFFPF
ncbi:MAG: hypothetical protein HZA84_01180 [Thaumarchaeota archaeon]|nr:hypothetical protein [Nitrososphaerota archaeon]